jgi:hypothetical protein
MICFPWLESGISAVPDVMAVPSWFILLISSSEPDTVSHGHVCSQQNNIQCNLYTWHPTGYRVNYFPVEHKVKHNLIHWKSKCRLFSQYICMLWPFMGHCQAIRIKIWKGIKCNNHNFQFLCYFIPCFFIIKYIKFD